MSAKPRRHIRKAAVLGAGVMGAQIAAHLVNAGVDTLLFELPGKKYPNELVDQAIKRLAKLKPAPLGTPKIGQLIKARNYDEHLSELAGCDLIIEAIAERMDWKKDLYEKIAPHVDDDAILATNTSGLSINELSSVLPQELHDRFCGVHFFNPPRYMHLAELIPGADTKPQVMDNLETFLTTTVGKGVVRAKDTPNFIGNRIGVFSMLAAMHHTEQFDLRFDVVDALTGPALGRPKSATYRTADVVGLDTMAHVIGTMNGTLPDDPWRDHFEAPSWLQALIEQGALGQKTGAGFYRKQGKVIEVLDRAQANYTDSGAKPDETVAEILKERDAGKRLAALRASDSDQAQFLWAIFRDLFHYCAATLESIAETARDVDLAIRWGYGWKQGPFETWQAAGWQQVAQWISEDIAAGKAMSDSPLPEWVAQVGDKGVYHDGKSYSPAANEYLARRDLPVYERQFYPDPVLTESHDPGTTIFEDDFVRLWHQGDDIAILSFKSKMHALSQGVIAGIKKAVEIAEQDYSAMIIWQNKEPFCVGADLTMVTADASVDDIKNIVGDFQAAMMAMQQSAIPVVGAVRGMALGGGCEVILHCNQVVAAFESYIGLVEVGVGLLPAGGGLKELATRASAAADGDDPSTQIQKAFEGVAMAKVSASALDAKELGYLKPSDLIVMNTHEVLYVAKQQAKAMVQSGYRPALPEPIVAAGRTGAANLKAFLTNMLEGQFISPHDYEIGSRIADAICGGEVDRGTTVDAEWLLRLEREHFAALAGMQPTQERIAHMLKTGKPLRN